MSYPTNLATANFHRAAAAAIVEVERVRDAMRELDGNARHHLLAVGQLRLDNPTASYAELARIAGLTKDQVRSRIRQLLILADQHRRKSPLPARYRRAFNLEAGYEIHVIEPEDTWVKVLKVLRIYAPANIIRFDLADGTAVVEHPQTEIMSRRPTS